MNCDADFKNMKGYGSNLENCTFKIPSEKNIINKFFMKVKWRKP